MDYKDLIVWQKSRILVLDVFEIINVLDEKKERILIDQLSRAVVSVPSNIAEGIGRQYKKETIQFLSISRASLNETETLIFLAGDKQLIDDQCFIRITSKIIECKRLIQGLINYYKNSNLR